MNRDLTKLSRMGRFNKVFEEEHLEWLKAGKNGAATVLPKYLITSSIADVPNFIKTQKANDYFI